MMLLKLLQMKVACQAFLNTVRRGPDMLVVVCQISGGCDQSGGGFDHLCRCVGQGWDYFAQLWAGPTRIEAAAASFVCGFQALGGGQGRRDGCQTRRCQGFHLDEPSSDNPLNDLVDGPGLEPQETPTKWRIGRQQPSNLVYGVGASVDGCRLHV